MDYSIFIEQIELPRLANRHLNRGLDRDAPHRLLHESAFSDEIDNFHLDIFMLYF